MADYAFGSIRPTNCTSFFEREAQHIASEFENLLNRCTGGAVPNYVTFYMEAGNIFGRGYSHKVLERVANIARDWFADLESSESAALDQKRLVQFQRFKLLLGYVMQYMPDPARSIFLTALQMDKRGS
jgi:hypothetical protein